MEDDTGNHENETPCDNEETQAQKEEAEWWCISIILDILVLTWPFCSVVVDWLVSCFFLRLTISYPEGAAGEGGIIRTCDIQHQRYKKMKE